MTTPPLPQPKTYIVYDYAECRTYLEARDGYDEENYAQQDAAHLDRPYQNFWHFILQYNARIHNGCFFTMDESWAVEAQPWQQAILEKYLSTFGTLSQNGLRAVDFYVWL